MTPTAHGLAEILPLLRTAAHVDSIRMLADALDRKLADPAISLDDALGFATPAPEVPQRPKRPGPSKARQRARQRRDDALRLYHREHMADHSASAAASIMTARLARYIDRRLGEDLGQGNRPAGRLEKIAFDVARDKIKIPSANSLALILLGHR